MIYNKKAIVTISVVFVLIISILAPITILQSSKSTVELTEINPTYSSSRTNDESINKKAISLPLESDKKQQNNQEENFEKNKEESLQNEVEKFTSSEKLDSISPITSGQNSGGSISKNDDICPCELPEDEGCNNDFWENHLEEWTTYTPDTLLGEVFQIPSELNELSSYTLVEALKFDDGTGGSVVYAKPLISLSDTDDGVEQLLEETKELLKEAVAALLNAAHPYVKYPDADSEILEMVNTALSSFDDETITSLKNSIAGINSLGCDCSVPNYCIPDVDIDKKVKYQCCGNYVDNITIDEGDWVTFKLQITNTGQTDLALVVRDNLPYGLQYSNSAKVDGVPQEPIEDNGFYYWYLTGIAPDQVVVIEFRAIAVDCGEFENIGNVSGEFDDTYVYDEDTVTINVNCVCTGKISGFKFYDQNQNGAYDNDETPIQNWEIKLYDGQYNYLETTYTDVNGYYAFVNLEPATYIVEEVLQSLWFNTTPLQYSVDILCCGSTVSLLLPQSIINLEVDLGEYQGFDAFFKATLSNVEDGYDVENGVYRGWCVQHDLDMPMNTTFDVKLYSSYDFWGMPLEFKGFDWEKVNYILNNKIGFISDVQEAIWNLTSGLETTRPNSLLMINDANLYGEDFCPDVNSVVAVLMEIIDYSGDTQRNIIEVETNSIDFGNYQVQINPGICLTKIADPTVVLSGETVDYTYEIFNYGDVELVDLELYDDKLGYITLPKTNISPQELMIVTVDDVALFEDTTNLATVCGMTPDEQVVCANDTETVTVINPCICLTKTVEPTVILSGDTVDYTYDIYNCGTVELSSLTLNDDQLGPITLPSTTLAAGDSMTVYVNDVQLFENTTNLATVCGTAPTQDVVCSNDTATVTIVSPGILLIKTVDPETIFSGETVDYTFEIYNIGDVELSGITLVDDQLGPITLPTTTLGVGASMTVTVNDVVLYVTTTNTAVVTGYSPNQDMVQSQDDATVVVQCPANPSISLNKTVKPETIYPGETVDYNFEIWNNGETSLSGITLVDDHLGPITLPTTSLAIGESMTVNVNDVMICQNTTNYAEVAGYSPIQELVTDDDTATVIVIAPCINIIKTVSPETIFLGDTATWNITVENTGDVILTDVIVTDDNMGVLGSMITLLPGEIIYFEYTTSPLQTILNTAIVEGKDPIGGIVSDTDSARVIVLIPCPPEVWVDDSWHNQLDVNLFNPDLVWGYDAFRVIQDGIDAVCECGIVHVRAGYYIGQILINKSLALLGDPGAKIFGDNLNIYTIDVSQETYKPIIFAFAGTLVGNNVITNGNIGVTVDGFEIDGNNEADSIAILYHNVQDMCQPAQISNNRILKVDIAIQINGCTDSTTIIYNKIPWENQISDKIAVLITPFGGCDPSGVEIHYNYWGVECGWNIGVWNQGTVIANATFNWWGADDGPASLEGYDNYDAITGRLADGYGDRVIGLVHFDPWWGVESSASASKYNAHVGELICFSASDSFAYDETGDITNKIKYKWNFGDGMYSFSKNYCRSYSQPGTYTVSLMVEVSSYDLDNEFVAGYLRDWDTFTIVVV